MITSTTMATYPVGANGQMSVARRLLLVLGGSLLIVLSAKIQVPFQPVPMTMQTLVVMCLGLAYGRNLAFATVALYLLQGAAGLPVFADTPAKGIGLAYMFGSTGGYLIGFLAAATLCGWLAERGWDRRIHTAAAALLAGAVLIYLPGLLWLASLYGWDKPVLAWGLWPFLPGELTKVAIGACLMPALWSVLNRLQSRP
jgi:biotin transport system substrate-specific component